MLTRPALLRSVTKLSDYKAKINLSENEAAGHYSDFKDEALRKKTIVVLDITADTVPPLHYNSLLGLAELVPKLLAAGEEINTAGPLGIFLAAATYCGHKKFVRVLLNEGAGVNAVVQQTHHRHEKQYSPSAILYAAGMGREDIVTMLLAEGADVNIYRVQPLEQGSCYDVNTPLRAAAGGFSAMYTRIVQLLLDAGAEVNACGHGALLYRPSMRGNNEVMSILLDAGVNPNEYDKLGTPVWHAIKYRNLHCAKLLVERGADSESIDSRLVSALHSQCYAAFWIINYIEIALKVKPNLNTELLSIAAAKSGYSEYVRFLLLKGTAPDAQDKNGVAALHAAAFAPEDDIKTLEGLLDANANVNIHGGPFW